MTVTSLSDYQDILYWCQGSTQEYLSMNMLCSSDHPTHPLHSTGFISISYQFISGHLHYQSFSCPLIKMSNPILFDKWRKCKLGWMTHELWENCLSSKAHKLLHHANWYRVNLQMYVFKQNLIFIGVNELAELNSLIHKNRKQVESQQNTNTSKRNFLPIDQHSQRVISLYLAIVPSYLPLFVRC